MTPETPDSESRTSAVPTTHPSPGQPSQQSSAPQNSEQARSALDHVRSAVTGGLLSRTGLQRFSRDAGMVGSGRSQLQAQIADELRARLAAVVTLLAVASLIMNIRWRISSPDDAPVVMYALLIVLVLFAALLHSRVKLPLILLRLMELIAFAGSTLALADIDYGLMVRELAQGNAGTALAEWNRALAHAIVVIAAYGLFIPNTWRRALAIVLPIAAMPVVLLRVVIWNHSDSVAGLEQVFTAERQTFGVGILLVAAAIAVYGTYTMNRLRVKAVEANVMGQYTLKTKIGEGGMGEVWLAEHQMLARPAAIKLIRSEMLGTGGAEAADIALRRFEREAQSTAALGSPHTIELYDFGISTDGVFYYVMEFLDGLDLDTMVKEHGPLPPNRAIHLLLQACDSLGDAHNHGMVHRDIKPANIFACRKGMTFDFVKVLDFGLVKTEAKGEAEAQLTTQGMTSGTPAYMPPELALATGDIDGRADIYALGCVGYWLLTGQYVFESGSPMAMVVDHVNKAPVPPSQRTEMTVPPELDRVIMKCLEKDPAKRYQNTSELADDLATCPCHSWDRRSAQEWWELHGSA